MHLKPNGGTSETPYLYQGLTFLLQIIAIILIEFSHLFTSVYRKVHEASKTQQRYAHLHNEVLREASEVMDDIDNAY